MAEFTINKFNQTGSIGKGLSKASDGAIMAAAISAGSKLTKSNPTMACKIAKVVGIVGLCASAIIAKNVYHNVSKDLGNKTNNYLISVTDYVSELLHLTGNNVTDLLLLIQFFNRSQIFFLTLIIYNMVLYNINESKLEYYLKKLLPQSFVAYILKAIIYFKKSGFILIICLIILLIAAILLSNNYFDFFLNNFDGICELHINSKK